MAINKQKAAKQLVELLIKSPIVSAACAKIGLSRATYYRWREDEEDFRKIIDEAIGLGVHSINDLAESQLIKKIKDADFRSIQYWLNNRNPNYAHPSRLVRELFEKTQQENSNYGVRVEFVDVCNECQRRLDKEGQVIIDQPNEK